MIKQIPKSPQLQKKETNDQLEVYLQVIQLKTSELNEKNKKLTELNERNYTLQKELEKKEEQINNLTKKVKSLQNQQNLNQQQLQQENEQLKKEIAKLQQQSPLKIPPNGNLFNFPSLLISGISCQISKIGIEQLAAQSTIIGQGQQQSIFPDQIDFQQIYTDSKNKTRKYYQELFESFYILGVDETELKNTTPKTCNVKSRVYYKKEQEGLDQKIMEQKQIKDQIIEGYCYPTGNKVERITNQTDFDVLEELIYQGRAWDINESFSTFVIRSNEDFYNSPPINIDFLEQYNPDKMLYGLCLQMDDFIETSPENFIKTKEARRHRIFWKFKKTYCFLTHFPIQSVFKELLLQIINIIKFKRTKVLPEKLKESEQAYQDIDGLKIIDETKILLDAVLKQCSYQQLVKEGSQINIDLNKAFLNTNLKEEIKLNKIIYKVPSLKNVLIQNRAIFAHIAMQVFTYEDFSTIFAAILQEAKVIFVCENNNILTAVTQFFHNILLPFKWPHPVIYSIPQEIVEFVETPSPLICGLNQSATYVLAKKKFLKSTDIIFVYVMCNGQKIEFQDQRFQKQLLIPRFTKDLAPFFQNAAKRQTKQQITFNYTLEQQKQSELLLKKTMELIKSELMDIIPPKEDDFIVDGKKLNNLFIQSKLEGKIEGKLEINLIKRIIQTLFFQEYLKYLYFQK